MVGKVLRIQTAGGVFVLVIGLASGQTPSPSRPAASPSPPASSVPYPPQPSFEPLASQPQNAFPRPTGGVAGDALPVSHSGYQIVERDVLEVSVYGAPEFSRLLRVGLDGTVRLPLMQNTIALVGNTALEAEEIIRKSLMEEGLLVDPIVSVHMREHHGNPVRVSGSVASPTVFAAVGSTTLLDAITRAGGLSSEAGADILIERPGRQGAPPETIRVATRDFREGSPLAQRLVLRGGETVRVLPAQFAFVLGSVKSPGQVPIADEEGIEFLQMLAVAGGMTPTASKKAIVLRSRPGSSQKDRFVIDIKKVLKYEMADVRIQPNDVVYLPDSGMKKFLGDFARQGVSQTIMGLSWILWR